MARPLLFGQHVPEALCADLRGLPDLLVAAWSEAAADPENAKRILDAAAAKARHVSSILELHLRDAVERGQRRATAAGRLEEQVARSVARVAATAPDQLDPHGFYVYLLWGGDAEKPLYIGQSTNIYSRLGSHMTEPGKRRRVSRITILRCAGKKHMDRTELDLIRQYQPELNHVGLKGGAQHDENHVDA